MHSFLLFGFLLPSKVIGIYFPGERFLLVSAVLAFIILNERLKKKFNYIIIFISLSVFVYFVIQTFNFNHKIACNEPLLPKATTYGLLNINPFEKYHYYKKIQDKEPHQIFDTGLLKFKGYANDK